MDSTQIGTTIRARRRDLGLRQRDLAELTDVSERFVRDVELGKPSLRLDKLIAVCTTLGLRVTVEGP